MPECPSDNTLEVDQSTFWGPDGVNWDAHRIGWAISGGCALLTWIISAYTVLSHARHYTCPPEQRQIIRILYMPPVYAIISFFSYRYFRSYTYYSLVEVIYEAFTIAAFLMLIIEYVAATATGHSEQKALERKDKRALPIPFCCWRYRPTKAYFMYTIKWSVLQYVIVRPVVSIVSIIAQHYHVLCENGGFNFHFVYVYTEIVDFISITVALYGLLVFYGLTKDELRGRRPLAKFLCIKLIVMFTFYQSFVFSLLEGRVIHETTYWTETNIADGLTALTICIEMVFFALLFWWAYPVSEYTQKNTERTRIWRPLWDSINFSDFALEIYKSLKFYVDYFRGKPYTRTRDPNKHFQQAFGIEASGYERRYSTAGGEGYDSKPGMTARSGTGVGESYPMSNTAPRSPSSGSPLHSPAYAHMPPPSQSFASRPSGDGSGEEVLLGRRGDRERFSYDNGYGGGGTGMGSTRGAGAGANGYGNGPGYGYSGRNSESTGATRGPSTDIEMGRGYREVR